MYVGPALAANFASRLSKRHISKQREQIMMDPAAVPRRMARLQYAVARLPFTLLDEVIVARYWGQDAPVRRGLERYLGSLDLVAGWLLADGEISRRGQALMRGTGYPARDGAPARDAPAQLARAGQTPQSRQVKVLQVGERDREMPDAIDVTFTLPAEVHAGTVALCGEFNNWSAEGIRLQRGSDGSWRATVALEPGRSYRYRYLLDGERWENAWQADCYAPNSYGSTDSVVVVERPAHADQAHPAAPGSA